MGRKRYVCTRCGQPMRVPHGWNGGPKICCAKCGGRERLVRYGRA